MDDGKQRNVESIAVREMGWMSMQTQPAIDDKQILKRIASGDREALAELYDRYQQHLFRYLLQLTPDYGLAEEILQDTFVAVWKSARTFEGRSTVLTWLISITRRQTHNTLRRHKLPTVDEAVFEELAATEPEPADSTLNMGATIQYRIIGDLSPRAGAVPTAPSLEDSYVWLMREKRSSSATISAFS